MFNYSRFEFNLRKYLSFSLLLSLSLFSNTSSAEAAYAGSGFSTNVSGFSVNFTSGGLQDFYLNDATMTDRNNVLRQDPFDGGLYADLCWDNTCNGFGVLSPSNGGYVNYSGSGTPNTVARTYTGASQTINGLSVTASYKFSATHAATRVLMNITNSTNSSVTRIARMRSNLGSDGSSRLVYDSNRGATIGSYWTYSANTSFGSGVLWTITTDQAASASATGSDPVMSFVFGEASASVLPSYVGSTGNPDDVAGSYQLTIPANSTRTIMMIWGMGAISTTSNVLSDAYTGVIENLTSYAKLPADLKSDLTSTVQGQIVNWNIGPTLTSSAGSSFGVNIDKTFTTTISASGGTAPYTITRGQAVSGISFNSGTGLMTIDLTTPQTVQETLTVTDSGSKTGILVLTIRANSPPTSSVTNSTITTTVGRAASETMTVTGGTSLLTAGSSAMTFSRQSSLLQSGITLDTSSAASNIAVLRIGTTGVAVGTYVETITATDNVGSTTLSVFTVIVNPSMTLTNTRGYTVPATVGRALSETITVTGGTGNKTFTRTTSSNSAISIDTSTASSNFILLRATSSLPAGTYFETITVTDSRSATSSIGLRIVATAALTFSAGSSSTVSSSAGTDSFETRTVTGGSLPITFTVSSSPSNSGITISSSSNTQAVVKIASTVAAGSYTLTLTGTDTASVATSHTINLTVASPLRFSNSNPTFLNATLGKATSLQLDFVNGSTNKVFTISQSAAMQNPGITLDTSTVSSGFVRLTVSSRVGPGTYSVTVNGTDATGVRIATTISVTVNNPIRMGVTSTAGAFGLSSMKFNGTNQFIRYNPGTKWALGSTWTIEWWQYETSTSGTQTIMGQIPNFFRITLSGSDLQLWTGATTPVTLANTLVVADRRNKWTHYAIVSNNGSAIAYQNGVALSISGISGTGLTNSQVPSNYALCIAVSCSNASGTTGTGGQWFGGYLANIAIDKRAKYSGTQFSTANFTPDTNLSIDSNTVIALTVLTGENVFTDLSNSAVTQDASYPTLTPPVGDVLFPNLTLSLPVMLQSTQGIARNFSSIFATGGTGVKTMTSTGLTSGVTYSASNGLIAARIQESATAVSSTQARITNETVTATDATGATTTIPVRVEINPPIVLTATSLNPTTAAGIDLYDTVTATFGTGTKIFYSSTQTTPSITRDFAADNLIRVKVGKTTPVGTYYETVTAIDTAGDSETVVITITVTPGLSMTSATGSTSLTATAGRAASLQLNTENGSGTKTFVLTHLGTASAGITIDTTTVVGSAILRVANTVAAGTYSERVTVTDAQGASVSLTISVTVNQAPSISYAGSVSGAITLTTTAGKSLTSGAFTAALGTGIRTLSISGVNSQVSIDTSTSNIGYLILGSGLTATNSTTERTFSETITVTDSLSATSIRVVTIVVKPAISLTASFLTLNTTAGISITDTVTASNGTGNKTFSLAISPNVSGLSFTNSVTDRIVITVANTLSAGSYTITVTATDSVSATSSIDIALNVASSLSISGGSSITSTAGYSFTSPAYTATGGSGNTNFALVSPPAGVTLSAATGTPSILIGTSVTAGTYNLTLRATDSVTATTTFSVTLLVNAPVSLTGTPTISKDYGTSGTYIFNTSGGTAPFTFSTTNICTTEVTTSGGITTEKIMGVSSCDWQVPAGVTSLSGVLVVGGGGGGGWGGLGGGGGAGEVESATAAISVTPGNKIAVTVGAGGEDGYTASESTWRCGFNGENSVFGSVIALGGGAGAGSVTTFSSAAGCLSTGNNGGSGGGGNTNGVGGSSSKSSQTGWVAYGNAGGNNTGGGGGAGEAGNPWSAADGIKGKGGAGINLMGMTFAGGGGAWNGGGATNGNETGGSGGGGRARGGTGFPCNSCDATSGTGSGGGAGGRGGSGFVAIQYPTPAVAASTTAFTFQTISKTTTGQLRLVIPEGVAADTYTSTIRVFNDTVSDNQIVSFSYPLTIVVNKATPALSLSIPGGVTTVTYGSPVTISASSTTAGNFDFRRGGTSISGCGTKATTSGVATCSWTPTDTSTSVISAAFTPTDAGNWKSVTSSNLTLTVSQADTLTVTFAAQDFTYTGSAVSVSRSYTLSGLTAIDSITAVTTLITGTANDNSSYSSNTAPTKAGAYSLTGTAVTFSGSTRASYYKSITYVPANINVNRAANVISLRYGSNNIITYKPTGVETNTVSFLGDGTASFSTPSSTYCSVNSSNGDLTTLLAGSCDVSVAVTQGTNYFADTSTVTVTISKAPRTISISSLKNSLKYSETATVTTTVNFDALDGAISYSVGATTGCSFDPTNNQLTAISGTATCSLAAAIGAGDNYLSATSNNLSFTLSKADAPTLTLIAPANMDYSPTATSADMPLPTFTVTGLKLDDTATALSNMTITYLASGTYSYNSTTVPTGANVYTLTPSNLTLSTGDISNYQTPNFVGATWTINQIAQAALLITSLLQEGITVPYDIQYSGGSTNGVVTANIVSGGTATSCSFAGNSLRANSTGSCVIQLTMAGNQNYLAVSSETITVVIANFVQSIFNFDSLASGSTGISISSEVAYTVDVEQCSSECVPTITSVSPTTFQGGDQIVISGTDFLGATAVIFNRSVFVTLGNGLQVDSNSQITVLVPMGLTVGPGSVSVKNDSKISFRVMGLTITG